MLVIKKDHTTTDLSSRVGRAASVTLGRRSRDAGP